MGGIMERVARPATEGSGVEPARQRGRAHACAYREIP